VTTRLLGSNLRPAFRSHSVYASRRSVADGLPLILLLLPGKYTAFLLLASWKLPGAAVHIFLLSFHHISFPPFPARIFSLCSHGSPFSFDLYRILSRVTQTQSYYYNIIWWYIYTINDDRLKQHLCTLFHNTVYDRMLEMTATIDLDPLSRQCPHYADLLW